MRPSIDQHPIQLPVIRKQTLIGQVPHDHDYSNLTATYTPKPHDATKIYKSFNVVKSEDLNRTQAFRSCEPTE